MELQITNLALPIFAFYLIVFCNFLKELLGCRLIDVLDTNMYAKHLLGFMLLFTLIIMVDPKNMEANLIINILYTIAIYVLFIITTRLPYYIMLFVLILLLCIYIINTIAKKKKEDNLEEEYKSLKLVESILFIITVIISVIGFVMYLYEKYNEYGSTFSFWTFMIGKATCRKFTPDTAKIL